MSNWNLNLRGNRDEVKKLIGNDEFGGDKSSQNIIEFSTRFIDDLPPDGSDVVANISGNTEAGFIMLEIRSTSQPQGSER